MDVAEERKLADWAEIGVAGKLVANQVAILEWSKIGDTDRARVKSQSPCDQDSGGVSSQSGEE